VAAPHGLAVSAQACRDARPGALDGLRIARRRAPGSCIESAMRYAYERGMESGRRQAALEAEVARQVTGDQADDLPDDPCAMG
jgi:hypothetical protein